MQPVVDLADEVFGPPASKFLSRVEHDVQAAATSCLLDHVDGFVQRGGGGVEFALAQVSEAQVAQDNGAGFVVPAYAARGFLQSLLGAAVITEEQGAGTGHAVELGR